MQQKKTKTNDTSPCLRNLTSPCLCQRQMIRPPVCMAWEAFSGISRMWRVFLMILPIPQGFIVSLYNTSMSSERYTASMVNFMKKQWIEEQFFNKIPSSVFMLFLPNNPLNREKNVSAIITLLKINWLLQYAFILTPQCFHYVNGSRT